MNEILLAKKMNLYTHREKWTRGASDGIVRPIETNFAGRLLGVYQKSQVP